MPRVTKKEAEEAIDELKQATLAMIEIDDKVEKVELERRKAQKRLSIARDTVRSLRIQ